MKFLALTALLALAFTSALRADPTDQSNKMSEQGNVTKDNVTTQPVDTTATPDKPFTIAGGVDFKTAYFFRGYNVVDTGYIIQPSLTFTLKPIQAGPFTFAPYIGVWNDITERQLGPNKRLWSHWSEFDIQPGVTATYQKLTLDVSYLYQSYPNSSAGDGGEIDTVLSYDDSKDDQYNWDGITVSKGQFPIALNPHIAFDQEVIDLESHSNHSYLEFGLAPSASLGKFTATLPVTLGTSIDKYYTNSNGSNEFWGYGDIGLNVQYNFTDNLYAKVVVDYVYLFSDSAREANHGDLDKVIGTVTLGFSF